MARASKTVTFHAVTPPCENPATSIRILHVLGGRLWWPRRDLETAPHAPLCISPIHGALVASPGRASTNATGKPTTFSPHPCRGGDLGKSTSTSWVRRTEALTSRTRADTIPTSLVRIRTALRRPLHPTEAKNLASSSAVIRPRHSNQPVSAGSESAHRRTGSRQSFGKRFCQASGMGTRGLARCEERRKMHAYRRVHHGGEGLRRQVRVPR